MRIAIFHNRYRERGGEDTAVDGEAELLEKGGHTVVRCIADNREALSSAARRAAHRAARAPEPRERRARRAARERGADRRRARAQLLPGALARRARGALGARGARGADAAQLPPAVREREPAARGARVRGVRAARPVARRALRLLPRLARADARLGGRDRPPPRARHLAPLRRPLRRADRVRGAQARSRRGCRPSASRCCRTCSRIRASPRRRAAARCSSDGSRPRRASTC